MKFYLTIFFIAVCCISNVYAQDLVYVWKGKSSKVYHKLKSCRGLSHCSTSIHSITLGEAKKMGRRACKIEFKWIE